MRKAPPLVALFVGSSLAVIAQSPPPQAAGYQLAFDDEFSTLSLSPNGTGSSYNWYPGIWWDAAPPPSLITDANSALNLTWSRNQVSQSSQGTSISTFSRDTQYGHTFRYGYFEARMKWDVTTGAWPAFWMLPKQAAQGAQETGELDVFEGQGDSPHTYFGTIHDWVGQNSTSNDPNAYNLASTTDFSQWHTYGVLWTPGTVTWYFDNVALHSASTPAIFDQQDFFLVLTMSEGANWQVGSLDGVTCEHDKSQCRLGPRMAARRYRAAVRALLGKALTSSHSRPD